MWITDNLKKKNIVWNLHMSNTEKKSTFAGNKKIVRPYCGLSQKIIMTHTHTHLDIDVTQIGHSSLSSNCNQNPPSPKHTHTIGGIQPRHLGVCVCSFDLSEYEQHVNLEITLTWSFYTGKFGASTSFSFTTPPPLISLSIHHLTFLFLQLDILPLKYPFFHRSCCLLLLLTLISACLHLPSSCITICLSVSLASLSLHIPPSVPQCHSVTLSWIGSFFFLPCC